MIKTTRASLLLAFLFSLGAIGALYLVQMAELVTGLLQVLVLVSGVCVAGAVTIFQRFVERDRPVFRTNLATAQAVVTDLLLRVPSSTSQAPTERAAWDLTPAQLLAADKSLALAKIRIELERQLRRIAAEAMIDVGSRPVGATGLARELVRREIMPGDAQLAIAQVARVCNQAVHGMDVSEDDAASTVQLGSELLEYLSRLQAGRMAASNSGSSSVSPIVS